MRIIKFSALALLLLLTAGIGVALLAPAIVVRPVLANYLRASGFELAALDELSVSTERANISRIALHSNSLQLTAMGIQLTYSLSGLINGNLSAITINSLEVEILPEPAVARLPITTNIAADTVPLSDQLTAALQTLSALPLANLRINAIDIHSADTSLDLALQVQTQPLRISGMVASSDYEDVRLQIEAATAGDSAAMTGKIIIQKNIQTVIQSDFSATLIADTLQLTADVTVDPGASLALFDEDPLFAALSSSTKILTLALNISATDLDAAPALTLVELLMDSPDNSLQLSHTAESRQSQMQLQLPLRWIGDMTALNQPLQLASDAVQMTIGAADGTTQLESEVTLTNARFGCTLELECTATANLSTQIPLLHSAAVLARDLTLDSSLTIVTTADGFTLSIPELEIDNGDQRLLLVGADTSLQFALAANSVLLSCDPELACAGSGKFDFNALELGNDTTLARDARAQGSFTLGYSANGIDILLPETELALPSLSVGDAEASTTLALSNLSMHIGTQSSISLDIATEYLDPGIADLQLRDPSITGNMRYAEDALEVKLNLALANQLQAVVTADFSTTTQSGQLNWEIPTYYFSSITPLSGLITQSLVEMDIVSGSLAGRGSIDISSDAARSWQTTGPIAVELNEISGFVADTVFVGLNSSFQASFSGEGHIHSQNLLSARIATLDPGLPLTDIRWNYSFDSAAQNITIKDLAINTLGGEITMADFSYDIQNPDSKLIVVLTNLDLQAIVDLAQYPGIRVEGLISGYLPLTLKGNTLTVERGLVGALQPGGTIRYASGSPMNTGNASLDLVNQALANYHYQIMNTYVYYNDDGDLRLEVQLLGNNPDMYNGQVVNLNVNIDDNIPTLLRSLQASRTITDALELRLRNQRPGNGNQGM